MGQAPHPTRSAWDIDRRGLRLAALVATLLLGLAAVVASAGLHDDQAEPADDLEPIAAPEPESVEAEPVPGEVILDGGAGPPAGALIALAVVALALIVGAVAWLVRRRNDPAPEETEELHGVASSEEAIDLLSELLRPHPHVETPRQTILRMYAALETGLGRPHLARRPHETPGWFVRRILGSHEALRAPLRDLVRAFEVARFSEHHVTEAMRDQATAALAKTRSHYAMHEVQAPSHRNWVVHREPAAVGR